MELKFWIVSCMVICSSILSGAKKPDSKKSKSKIKERLKAVENLVRSELFFANENIEIGRVERELLREKLNETLEMLDMALETDKEHREKMMKTLTDSLKLLDEKIDTMAKEELETDKVEREKLMRKLNKALKLLDMSEINEKLEIVKEERDNFLKIFNDTRILLDTSHEYGKMKGSDMELLTKKIEKHGDIIEELSEGLIRTKRGFMEEKKSRKSDYNALITYFANIAQNQKEIIRNQNTMTESYENLAKNISALQTATDELKNTSEELKHRLDAQGQKLNSLRKLQVQSDNKALVPPTVAVRQREKQAERGTNVELRCDVTGSPTPAVRWTKDGGELPDQRRVQDGVLTIYNVQPEDRGRYICTASSSTGSARDYIFLDIRSGPVIERPDRPQSIDSQVVNVGDRVSMECIGTGTPLPTVTWSRDDGPLEEDAILGEGILIIPSAKIEDTGNYTCLAVNETGSVSSKFILYVRAISPNRNIGVEGDGFIEFDKDYLPHLNTLERQTISFTINTTQSDGLIFWRGKPEGRPLRGGDHFSIRLKDGYVVFSFEMGSGPAMIIARGRVNDGQEHTITVSKLGRTGSLTVDNEEEVTGESQGFLQMLNANGNIFIGGVSLIDAMTDGKYSENFIGCIGNIVIQGKGPLELPQDALRSYNVKNCDL